MNVDSALVLELSKYGLIALCVVFLALTIVGGIAFWRTGQGAAKTFTTLFERADVLRLVTVITIVILSGVLALTGVIDGTATVALYSGIAGYVLGGTKAKQDLPREENPQ